MNGPIGRWLIAMRGPLVVYAVWLGGHSFCGTLKP
jgi:hypothetical protein